MKYFSTLTLTSLGPNKDKNVTSGLGRGSEDLGAELSL